MKITIEDNDGNITELGLADLPGEHTPMLRRAIHDIKRGSIPITNRFITTVKHTPKKKDK